MYCRINKVNPWFQTTIFGSQSDTKDPGQKSTLNILQWFFEGIKPTKSNNSHEIHINREILKGNKND